MLKEIYEQPAAAARDDRRADSRRTDRARRHRAFGGRDAEPPPDDHGRERDRVPRGRRRPVRARGVGAHPLRVRHRERVALPQPGAVARQPRRRDLPVRRDSRHARGDAPRARDGGSDPGDHEHDGRADHARGRLGALHESRHRDERGSHQDVHGAGHAPVPARPSSRGGPPHAAAGADRHARARASDLAREGADVPGRQPSDRGDRSPALRPAVLPLHRPPHRSAGMPRGCAEAQGDLVHPDGGVRRGGDEARPDRPARRVDAGRLRRHRLPCLRQGRLEHPGDPRSGRRRDRDRHRRERGHPAPRERRHLRPAHAPVPAGRAGGRARCSCSPTTPRACVASTSTSRGTSRRRSPSNNRLRPRPTALRAAGLIRRGRISSAGRISSGPSSRRRRLARPCGSGST